MTELTEAERATISLYLQECYACQQGITDVEPCECQPWTTGIEQVIDARLAPIRAQAVVDFAQWVATNRAYNGSDHLHGQSLYNECLNGVLPLWAMQYVREGPQDAPQPTSGTEGQGEGEEAGGRDWRPMTEDVTDHAMTYAGQHPDGRACMYHHRLGIHVFGGNPTTECLRDHWATCCPTCGPTSTEQHPRRPGINRCANCKEWLR